MCLPCSKIVSAALILILCASMTIESLAFLGTHNNLSFSTRMTKYSNTLFAATDLQDEEVTKQLERAKALLAATKAKIEAKENKLLGLDENDDDDDTKAKKSNVPFFAAKMEKKGDKKKKVIKSTNEEGFFTTDGDLMAELSESEEWEVRSLQDVFENEIEDSNEALADRDVAASIFGLQKTLQTDDFRKIFDKRNRFIGEQ